MTLWTILTPKAWKVLKTRGKLRANSKVITADFKDSYQWMIKQMVKRIPGYKGGYPLWAWVKKPDLRQSAYLPKGAIGYRVEFKIPDHLVLQSDFDTWHMVLNRGFFGLTMQELDQFDDFLKSKNLYLKGYQDYPKSIQKMIEKSWEKIFDLELCRQEVPQLHVQAVFKEIKLIDVIKVTKFKCR